MGAPTTLRPWVAKSLLGALLVMACCPSCGASADQGEGAQQPETPTTQEMTPAAGGSGPGEGAGGVAPDGSADWAESSRSPEPARAIAPKDAALYRHCGQADLALMQVASAIVDRRLDGKAPPTPRELGQLLRARGVPQVWPRAWAVTGESDEAVIAERLARWAGRVQRRGRARCGLARGSDAQGQPVVAAVAVDALADLRPLPTRARLSQWIELHALLHVPADGAYVLVLGPRGRPKRVLGSLSDAKIRSRFSVDQPGRWVVQVLANLATGPEPVLEAHVFAGVPPAPLEVPTDVASPQPATGSGTSSPAELLRLLNSVRKRERLAPLARDRQLEQLAEQHAARMAELGLLAHDLGSGTVEQRLGAAGRRALEVGENVAAARTLDRAHETLWASPSHRENMLHQAFRRVGIGVVVDPDGTRWVTQIFSH